MASAGQSYTINGVKVQFPHKPYPSQLSMMDKIIKGLNRKQNCLLESPTGSGKSLALLCSALAWQQSEREKARIENKEFMDKIGSGCNCSCGKMSSSNLGDQTFMGMTSANQMPPPPVNQSLLITTVDNTHNEEDDFRPDAQLLKQGTDVNQVSAAIEEMPADGDRCMGGCECYTGAIEKPNRKVPKIYFGTRTHKQIAQIVRELGKTAYSGARMTILSSREHSCIHPQVSNMSGKNEECKNLLDGPGCRFFDNVRRKVSHASLRLNGLGEAWDLEDFKGFCRNAKACSYFGGRQLKTDAEIVFCPYNYLIDPSIRESMEIYLKDQIMILDEAHNIEDSSREAASQTVSQKELSESTEDLNRMIEENHKVAEHRTIRDMLTSLFNLIESNRHTTVSDSFDSAYKMWTGIEMVAQLKNCGVGPERFETLKKCFAAISEVEETEQKRGQPVLKLKASTTKTVGGLFTVLDFIYRDNMRYMDDYRVAMVKSMVYVNTPTEGKWLNKRRRPRQMDWTFSLNFWCLNPAVAFSDFGDTCRSIVLTSGTLSPMQSFQSELGVPFPIQLEASHVIGKSQVWVGCISKGPRGTALLGNYQNAETFAYQDDVGALVCEVCSTVPHGVLCFVSSYKAIDKLTDRWKTTGLFDQIQQHKVFMCEPKASAKVDFDEVIQNYYDTIEEYEDAEVGGVTGAFFMAVCRGKVSEGLDFADNNARAVITVGIPFPNVKDPQVDLKKQYNNQHSASRGLLRGSDWYEIQAYRALNQALGRCIRHRNDWGALIIVDERFGKNPQKYTKGLSKWVRQKVQQFYAFSAAKSSLARFTQERLENPTTADVSVMNVSSLPQSPAPSKQSALPQPYYPQSGVTNGQHAIPYHQITTASTHVQNSLDPQQGPMIGEVQTGQTYDLRQDLQGNVLNSEVIANEVEVISENFPLCHGKYPGQGQLIGDNGYTSSNITDGGFVIPNPVPIVSNDSAIMTNGNCNVAACVLPTLSKASTNQSLQNRVTRMDSVVSEPQIVSNASAGVNGVLDRGFQTQEDIGSKTVISGDRHDVPDDPLEGHIEITDEDFEFNPRMASTQMPNRKGRKSVEQRSYKSERSQRRTSHLQSQKESVICTQDGKENGLKISNSGTGQKLAFEPMKMADHFPNGTGNLRNTENEPFDNYSRKGVSTKQNLKQEGNSKQEMKVEIKLESENITGMEMANEGCLSTNQLNVNSNTEHQKNNGKTVNSETRSKVRKSESRSDSPDMFDSEEELGEEVMSCDTELENVIQCVRNELKGNEVNQGQLKKVKTKVTRRSKQEEVQQKGMQDSEGDLEEYLLKREIKLGKNGKNESNESLEDVGKEIEEMDHAGGKVRTDKAGRRSLSLGKTKKEEEHKESIEGRVSSVLTVNKGGASKSEAVNHMSHIGNGTVNQTEEAEPLVTRRGSRVKKRRCLEAGGGNMNKRLKTKGVDFLDDLETRNLDTFHRVTCKACGKDICPKIKGYTQVRDLPPYVQKICSNSSVSLVQPSDIVKTPPKSTHLELRMADGMYINSYWSDSDDCCYKYLFCRCKSKTVALEVKCLGSKPHTNLQVGQIWIFQEFADISPISPDLGIKTCL